MSYLALNVEVPAAHIASGLAPDFGDTHMPAVPPITIHSGCKKPECAYAAVQYQCHWVWIDQNDTASKRTFVFMKVLLALADTSTKDPAPVLTIRAN